MIDKRDKYDDEGADRLFLFLTRKEKGGGRVRAG